MATAEQRKQLLAVTCDWCGAGPNMECTANGRRISTLDGGCHDARWRKALSGQRARVISAALAPDREHLDETPVEREPVTVGAVECPW